MRHQRRIRKLGRKSKHYEATRRNLVCSLFRHGRVKTTVAKAKAFRPFAEKMVTLAKKNLAIDVGEAPVSPDRGDPEGHAKCRAWVDSHRAELAARMHNLRNAISYLQDKEVVTKLFDEIAPRFAERAGGYTRIIRLARPRLGDAAPLAYLELVGEGVSREERLPRAARRRRKKQQRAEEAAAATAGDTAVAIADEEEASGVDPDTGDADAGSPAGDENAGSPSGDADGEKES